jgi:hypothetical protein
VKKDLFYEQLKNKDRFRNEAMGLVTKIRKDDKVIAIRMYEDAVIDEAYEVIRRI